MIKAQLEKRKQEKQNLLAMNQISGVTDAPAQAQAPSAQPAQPAALT
jgi:high-affinity K+ transport system ATPase subunit B